MRIVSKGLDVGGVRLAAGSDLIIIIIICSEENESAKAKEKE